MKHGAVKRGTWSQAESVCSQPVQCISHKILSCSTGDLLHSCIECQVVKVPKATWPTEMGNRDTTCHRNGTNHRLPGWFFLLLLFHLTERLISTRETRWSVFYSPQRIDEQGFINTLETSPTATRHSSRFLRTSLILPSYPCLNPVAVCFIILT